MTNYVPQTSVPVPNAQDLQLDKFCVDNRGFATLVAERQELKDTIQIAENRIAQLDASIGVVLDLAGVNNVVQDDWIVSRRKASKGRETLDRVRLLNAGVTPLQLAQGTVTGKPGKGGITVRSIEAAPEPVSTRDQG